MIDAFNSIRNAYAFIFREPGSKPSYFERQQQIKILTTVHENPLTFA